MAVDPFSEIYSRLWAILEANTALSGPPPLVKIGNRLGPGKEGKLRVLTSFQPGDLPHLIIRPVGGVANLWATSTSATIVQNYAIGFLATGDNPADKYFPVKWQVIRSFGGSDDRLGIPDLVTKARFLDMSDGPMTDAPQGEKAPVGWYGLITVSVEFRKTKAALTAGA